jgi:hypothetical protein
MTPRENNPAPDSYAKSQIPERDHGRAARVLTRVAAFVVTVALGVGVFLCAGHVIAWFAGSPA